MSVIEDLVVSFLGSKEVNLTPFSTITVPTVARPLVQGKSCYKVKSYLIQVESLGTSTYVAIGDKYQQNFRMLYVGSVYGYSGEFGEVSDLTSVYIRSDVGDAVIELVTIESVLNRGCE